MSELKRWAENMATEASLTGGARMDMFNATWPFAELSADKEKIALRISFSGTYVFPAAQVVAVKKYVIVPFIAWGIRIHHGVGSYPESVVFWYLGFPSRVLSFLRSSGFPAEKLEPNQAPEPMPLKRHGSS